jgi:hypothetical protein
MARLGHASPRAALRYRHAAESRDREIAARLDAVRRAGDGNRNRITSLEGQAGRSCDLDVRAFPQVNMHLVYRSIPPATAVSHSLGHAVGTNLRRRFSRSVEGRGVLRGAATGTMGTRLVRRSGGFIETPRVRNDAVSSSAYLQLCARD